MCIVLRISHRIKEINSNKTATKFKRTIAQNVPHMESCELGSIRVKIYVENLAGSIKFN